MIFRTPSEEIDKYWQSPALSQSKLKTLQYGPQAFKFSKPEKSLYYEEKGHLIIGTGVDVKITQGSQEFDKLHYIHKKLILEKPSDSVMSVVQELYDNKKVFISSETKIDDDLLKKEVETIIEKQGYRKGNKNWPIATKRVTLIREGSDYFELVKKAGGRQILVSSEDAIITDIVNSLYLSSNTADIFIDKPDVHIYYQKPIYFTYRGIQCKALPDIVVIDQKKRTIAIYDIKTTGKYTLYFPSTIKEFRYDIQAAWYTEAILSKQFAGYTMLPFQWIVETTIAGAQGEPLVYVCDESLMHVGKHGIPERVIRCDNTDRINSDKYQINRRPIVGFDNLIDDYLWYQENGWEKNRKIVETNGIIRVRSQSIFN